MPSNVGRNFTSVFLVLSAFATITVAQSPQASQNPIAPTNTAGAPPTQPIVKAPTAAEVMRDRISKAKAFIAVRNYYAAINELENIRRETSDQSVIAVTNVLLMNSYLEQGDHKKAQALLNQFYAEQKTTKQNSLESYGIVAGQIVKSARNQADRYRALGLSINDRNLPLEALNDLEKMRETVEMVITQSKELSADKLKSATGLGLMEEATNARVAIARDDYDARRWRDAVADSREQMAVSRSVIINAVDGTSTPASVPQPQTTTVPNNSASAALLPISSPAENKPVAANRQPSSTAVAANNKPLVTEPVRQANETQADRSRIIAGNSQQTEDANKVKATTSSQPTGPIAVGSLLPYAEKQSAPIYPPAARTMRATGVVRVEVAVDEKGNVVEVKSSSGPTLLQASAKDAIRKWKFRPIMIEGQAVQATGFVNFNFSL
ncbi:MAG: TonB family protein [bacterium]|nr:TonB family protein [bacterium]